MRPESLEHTSQLLHFPFSVFTRQFHVSTSLAVLLYAVPIWSQFTHFKPCCFGFSGSWAAPPAAAVGAAFLRPEPNR